MASGRNLMLNTYNYITNIKNVSGYNIEIFPSSAHLQPQLEVINTYCHSSHDISLVLKQCVLLVHLWEVVSHPISPSDATNTPGHVSNSAKSICL